MSNFVNIERHLEFPRLFPSLCQKQRSVCPSFPPSFWKYFFLAPTVCWTKAQGCRAEPGQPAPSLMGLLGGVEEPRMALSLPTGEFKLSPSADPLT